MRRLLPLLLGLAACSAERPDLSTQQRAQVLAPGLPSPPLPPDRDEARIAAAFERASPREQALYLSDLLLGAGLADDAASRSLLARLLGGPGGPATLQAALGEAAQRARQAGLLELARLQAQRAAELSGGLGPGEAAMLRHKLSETDDPAVPTALLLRYGACAGAMRDAARRPYPLRIRAASACLYSLSPADVALDLDGPPGARPLDPSWRALHGRMAPLLDEAAKLAPRLAPLAEALRRQGAAELRSLEREGLAPPDPAEAFARLPIAAGAEAVGLSPYDREPVLQLAEGAAGPAIGERIERLVRGDERRRLAVALGPAATGAALNAVADAGRRLGLRQLLLLLRREAGSPRGAAAPLALPLDLVAEGEGGEAAIAVARSAEGPTAELRAADGAVPLALADGGEALPLATLRDALPEGATPLSLDPALARDALSDALLKLYANVGRLRLAPAAPPTAHRAEASRALRQQVERRAQLHVDGSLTGTDGSRRRLGPRLRELRDCLLDLAAPPLGRTGDRHDRPAARDLRSRLRLQVVPGDVALVERGPLDAQRDAAAIGCLLARTRPLAAVAQGPAAVDLALSLPLADSNFRGR